MIPVSAAWGRTIVGSHKALYRATVCETFQSGLTPTGTRIPILGGDVVLDGTASIRGTLDLTTLWAWPERSDGLLAPYGNEIFIERGIFYTDALVEYKSLGYYRINTVDQDEPRDGPIRIAGKDRMGRIIKARLITPQQFLTGATLDYVVTTLVQQVYPTAVIEWDDDTGDVVLTRSLIAADDRFEFLDLLIRSHGKIWHFDYRGYLVIRTPPRAADPVWNMHSGPGGTLLKARRRLTDEDVYNAVVASGEAVDTFDPPRAVVYDNDPRSPTSYSGRFGPAPYFLTAAAIQNRAQAAMAAQGELRRRTGLVSGLDAVSVPNPAVEPWDPVSVRISRSGVRTRVLDTVVIPIVDGPPMTAATREQSLTLISGG